MMRNFNIQPGNYQFTVGEVAKDPIKAITKLLEELKIACNGNGKKNMAHVICYAADNKLPEPKFLIDGLQELLLFLESNCSRKTIPTTQNAAALESDLLRTLDIIENVLTGVRPVIGYRGEVKTHKFLLSEILTDPIGALRKVNIAITALAEGIPEAKELPVLAEKLATAIRPNSNSGDTFKKRLLLSGGDSQIER